MSLSFAVDTLSAQEWQKACLLFDHHNLYQTWDYAAFHSPASSTRDTLRCVAFRDHIPVVVGQFRVKRIPFLKWGVAEMEWGPLWRVDTPLESLPELEFFFREVRKTVLDHGKLETRIYPHSTHPYSLDEAVGRVLNECGFDSIQTETRNYDTIMIDLSKDLDVLRSELHPKWRNLLKKSESSELTVKSGRTTELFDRFINIYNKMRQSKDFATGVRIPIIGQMQEQMPANERFLVSVATEGGKDVGASVCAMTGTRMLYFLGATDPEFRGNSPGYLLQWNNIQIGKENGIRWYDLGGLVGEGVSRFKIRMGGTPVSFPRRFAIKPGILRSTVFQVVEKGIERARR